MTRKQSMMERVSNLMARAKDPASSEAEAELCLTRAEELMRKYGFDMSDVVGADAEEVATSETPQTKGRASGAMFYVIMAIAAFTNTKVFYYGSRTSNVRATYVGYGAERELAVWLHGHIENAIRVQSKLHNPEYLDPNHRAIARRSFAFGMAIRIAKRLQAMAEDMQEERESGADTGTGTDVMVIKNQKIEEYFNTFDLAKPRTLSNICGSRTDMAAGRAAGDGVSLGRPVGDRSASGPALLTRS